MKYKKSLIISGVVLLSMIFSSCSFFSKDCDVKLQASVTSSNGNFEGVKEAVEEGANVNWIPGSDQTRLGYTDRNPVSISTWINGGHYDIAKYLIEHDSNPNYMGDLGISLLMDAARGYNNDFCEFLLNHGANIAQIGKAQFTGYTALDCVFLGDIYSYPDTLCYKTYKLLIQHGAKITPETVLAAINNNSKIYGSDGECRYSLVPIVLKDLLATGQKSNLNPLLEASIIANADKVKTLADTNNLSQTEKNEVMFFTAALGKEETIKLLISKGYNIHSVDSQGSTLLSIAAKYNNVNMVKYLCELGLDYKSTDNNGFNALSLAISNNKLDNAKYLLSVGVKFQVEKTPVARGNDVLELASSNGIVDTVKFLIDNGYPINNISEYNAMISAADNNNLTVLGYLFSMGYSSNIAVGDEDLLQSACANPDVSLDTVKFIIEHGANVNGVTIKGKPLAYAVQNRRLDIVKYLIGKGADINTIPTHSDGSTDETALAEAISSGSFDIVKLLIKNGAKIDNSTIQFAETFPSKHIIEYLKQNLKK